jgi:hypothetical protein
MKDQNMNITARLYVHNVTQTGHPATIMQPGRTFSERVVLKAVHSSDPKSPNYSYSHATPDASVELTISNPAAFGAFKPGHEYDVVFSHHEKTGAP